MKRIPYYIYSLAFCLPLLFGCSDVIPEGERYEELPTITPERNILIEDFTGQFCSNCPEAHKVISDLQTQYGNAVIAVAIHAGPFGLAEGGNPNFVGLMQSEGNDYAKHWGVEAYPSGLINRTSGLLNHTEWAAYSRQAFAHTAQSTIVLAAEVVDDSIVIRTELQSATALDARLQLWITESNITTVQQNGGALEANYVHHHVYRASVNGVWGEDVTLLVDTPLTGEHRIALRDNWDTTNLSVVAFMYNEQDGVLQVTEQHVIANN